MCYTNLIKTYSKDKYSWVSWVEWKWLRKNSWLRKSSICSHFLWDFQNKKIKRQARKQICFSMEEVTGHGSSQNILLKKWEMPWEEVWSPKFYLHGECFPRYPKICLTPHAGGQCGEHWISASHKPWMVSWIPAIWIPELESKPSSLRLESSPGLGVEHLKHH